MAELPQGLNSLSLGFVEGLYEEYLRDPGAVNADWRAYFDGLEGGNGHRPQPLRPSFRPRSIFAGGAAGQGCAHLADAILQERVDMLVRNYRVRGHRIARLDPLGLPQAAIPELDPGFYNITGEDLDRLVSADAIGGRQGLLPLGDLFRDLRHTYCRSIGVQYMHIDDLAVRVWLQDRMEGTCNRIELPRAKQLQVLTWLTRAVVFEEFVQKRFVGAKRFSLEGGETLLPLLELAIERAAALGTNGVVLGMAHRGRLNVLANVIGKPPEQIFREFEDDDPTLYLGGGDVKYHLGHSTDRLLPDGRELHLSLCFNPSHLEFINPVAMGRVRAKEDLHGDAARRRGLCILIHGDAAFIGQGVVQETLNLSQLPAYTTGGTLHVIVNNQLGFTTPPEQGRSTVYASDVAKMLQIPIFHVNGEDPEAVAQAVYLAMDFRHEFGRDVVIDMYCYRRWGHNEGDEPQFTQPLMYQAIEQRKPVREGYLDHLLQLGGVTREEADEIAARLTTELEEQLRHARNDEPRRRPGSIPLWAGYAGGPEDLIPEADTRVPAERLKGLLQRLTLVPEEFNVHRRLRRLLAGREAMARGDEPLDWAAAEALALATLACEGHPVRITGQDAERGTFSHRHSVLHDQQTGERYRIFDHLDEHQARVDIHNSPLSEVAVLGFEYGYSLDCPDGLVVWEAQFGDFCNVPQVIIDQFLTSAEDKWGMLSGLVMLLPHGFEGQGPEHSSARLERFLLLAAEDSIQVANVTTPAQFFHLLRRQVLRKWRKPLVVMTPKSLLRHARVRSNLTELAEGSFQRVLGETGPIDPARVTRILLCSGKVYYDLLERREQTGRDDVAILRLEQYYPLRPEHLAPALAAFPPGVPVVWVQEEPGNMGAWRFLQSRFRESLLGRPFSGLHREYSASPATGSHSSHDYEQDLLLTEAIGPKPAE